MRHFAPRTPQGGASELRGPAAARALQTTDPVQAGKHLKPQTIAAIFVSSHPLRSSRLAD
jgi:hypothetical protein